MPLEVSTRDLLVSFPDLFQSRLKKPKRCKDAGIAQGRLTVVPATEAREPVNEQPEEIACTSSRSSAKRSSSSRSPAFAGPTSHSDVVVKEQALKYGGIEYDAVAKHLAISWSKRKADMESTRSVSRQ